MDDLKQLKSVLRSLVVSSPVQMTLSMLLRDYRNMMGSHLPIQKYGYRDPQQFLKERCGDCFLGFGANPILTPIVPECLKHIDEFVQKQNVSSKMKYQGKRRSINESALKPLTEFRSNMLPANTKPPSAAPTPVRVREQSTPERNGPRPPEIKALLPTLPQKLEQKQNQSPPQSSLGPPRIKTVDNLNKHKSISNLSVQYKENKQQDSAVPSMEAYKNFIKRRLPVYDSTLDLDNDAKSHRDSDSGTFTSESEQRTLSSSSSSTKAIQLEELKAELLQLVKESPNGVCTTEVMKLYRQRYGRELNFSRFGFSSVSVLACSLGGVHCARDAEGNTRVTLAPPAPAPAPHRAALARPRPTRTALATTEHADDEDALPWIDFDPDVFPEDCMSFSESIPGPPLEGVAAGAMLEVMVGEVYSPSHFWFYRLGPDYHIAMEDMMDEMTRYYNSGEGANRTLAPGAVRVGHYCSSLYERDWHRSLIVKIVDSDTVKVRHVDYGTVDRVSAARLRPLRRAWGALPAQAVRARLAGAMPAARGRRWPHAAAGAFLRLVQDRKLVANVVERDEEENIVELFLVDTSTERDVRIDLELVRAGHADARPAPPAHALAASYLYPRFDALESGATPNFADIHAYLRDGIALEYVEDYSRHVPAAPPAPRPPPPPPRTLDNRIPLIPRSLRDVKSAIVSPIERRDDTYISSSSEFVNEEPAAETTVVEPDDDDSSLDESQEAAPADSPHSESALEEDAAGRPRAELAPARSRVELPRDGSRESTPSPPPARAPARWSLEETPIRTEASTEKMKPACRTYPRMVPDIRTLRRADSRPHVQEAPHHFGPPLSAAPSLPAIPFFLVPSPGPPLPPFPSYAVHPSFPPRPYPAMEGYLSPPQRCFQRQMGPRFAGPPYPPGPMYPPAYYPAPMFSGPPAPISSSTPVSNAPIPKTSVSNGPFSAPPITTAPVFPATLPERPAFTPAVTASVAPQPAPAPPPPAAAPADEGALGGGARRVTTDHGEVTLSVSECEIFSLLSTVDPNAAHWYIVDALSRAMAARSAVPAAAPPSSRLNPEASEFRTTPCRDPPAPAPVPPLRPPHTIRPPPGFGGE